MLTDDELIARLRVCIQKNTAIDAFYRIIQGDLDTHQPKLNDLMLAIAEGNAQAPIFSNPDCSSYLLYSIENKKIPFWQGLTVYVYCVALMQLTNMQSLRSQDEFYKLNQRVQVFSLMRDGELTPEGRTYIRSVKKNYAKFPWLSFDEDKILQAARDGAAVDRWLIGVDCGLDRAVASFNRIFNILVPEVCYFQVDREFFYMPSVTLMNVFHAMQCEEPMQFQPGFGTPSIERLARMHKDNLHFLPMYSLLVKSNLLQVHRLEPGPFMALVHDVVHCFWANLLTKAERDLIMGQLVPVLQNIATITGVEMDARLSKAIEAVIFEWRDFNFSPLTAFPEDRREWVMHILMSAFGMSKNDDGLYEVGLYVNSKKFEDTDFCSEVQDDLLYLLARLRNVGPIWSELYARNKNTAIGRRKSEVVAKIELAALNSVPMSVMRVGLFATPTVKPAEQLEALSNVSPRPMNN